MGKVPIREILETKNDPDWTEFYPDAIEDLPMDRPKPKGASITITCFVNADHARDKVTRRSVTGNVCLLGKTHTIPQYTF